MRNYVPNGNALSQYLEAERSIEASMESIGAEPMVRDVLMEDHLFFSDGMPEEGRNLGVIFTPANKTTKEMTPKERAAHLQEYWREADKKMCRVFAENSAGGNVETQTAWSKRMGLKAPKNRDKRTPVDWQYWVEREEAPSASEIAWIFGYLYDPTLGRDDEGFPESPLTEMDVDVLEMSWPEQRTFRWNNPDGYEAWVKALKEEMGPHFDESLVLPKLLLPMKPYEKLSKFAEYFVFWDDLLEIVGW